MVRDEKRCEDAVESVVDQFESGDDIRRVVARVCNSKGVPWLCEDVYRESERELVQRGYLVT